jgi:hypothetical protein
MFKSSLIPEENKLWLVFSVDMEFLVSAKSVVATPGQQREWLKAEITAFCWFVCGLIADFICDS